MSIEKHNTETELILSTSVTGITTFTSDKYFSVWNATNLNKPTKVLETFPASH